MRNCWIRVLAAAIVCILLGGCGEPDVDKTKDASVSETEQPDSREDTTAEVQLGGKDTAAAEQNKQKENVTEQDGKEDAETGTQQEDSTPKKEKTEILHFVDVFGKKYKTKINPKVKKHDYDLQAFFRKGDQLFYNGDARYTSRLGVDVSEHQGAIDWNRVKAAGYEFAFIRIGYRGYGQAGRVCLDRQFVDNIRGAQAAGIDVGVYFFAQAINEEEAAEEARFVLENLAGYGLQLPVVYDPESILDAEARTDNVPGSQFTKNTRVFCQMIEEAGFEPMIYSNMLWEAFEFKLARLSEYPIWYADYEPLPQTPYHFQYWQYSNEGAVDGIAGNCDLDIQLLPVWAM